MGHGIRHRSWGCVDLILVLFAVVAALAGRLPALGERSWWIDELITAQVAARPLVGRDFWDPTRKPANSILGFTIQDTGPGPLAYLLEGIFASKAYPLGGEFWIRVPGVAAALLMVPLICLLGRCWWQSARVAAMCALCMSVFPPWVDFSTGARGYIWTTLLLLLLHTLLVSAVRRSSAGMPWLFYPSTAALSILAIYLTPLNIAWLWPYWMVLLFHLWRSPDDHQRSLRAYLLSALGVAVCCLPYLLLWHSRLKAKPGTLQPFSWTHAEKSFGDFAHELVREPWYGVLVVGPIVLMLALPPRLYRLRSNRTIILICWLLLLSGFLLAIPLAGGFFIAPRYFVGFSVPLLWGCGELLKYVVLVIRRQFGRLPARSLSILLPVCLCLTQLPAAYRYAKTPVHDWLNAVRWLNEQIRPADIVFCGPNADIEVLWAYSQRFGWTGQVPRWIIVEGGRQIDTSTAEAIRRALGSGQRLWYVTPFWGHVRSPEYWKLVAENFREAARFPGRGDIVILVHVPEAGSRQ